MESTERIEEDSMPQRNNDGRDELNLAEFPLCALANRLRPDLKTLRFEDRLFDRQRGETITRQLTITGSDAYGLPTALDDEVLLGLIQLSRLSQFAERTVRFTRYQLIGLLGWSKESKSYERIEASLNRWTGVTLYYRNAWWNKPRQCWVDEKFHILDNVRLYHREPASPPLDDEAATSVFVWNEVVFRSFQAGNLKSIDFDFFRELKSAIAKRLYRFLDKRFFHRGHWEFDLQEFAWEHAGLSRGYDTANLKRKLRPGIAELERRG
jgi:plasmid replication initiation protein